MKTVDELMALADDLAQVHYNLGNSPDHYDSERCDEARAALLTALQESVHAIDTSQEPVEKSGGNVQVQPVAARINLTKYEVEFQRLHGEIQRLAVSLWSKHYRDTEPDWQVLGDAYGVLSQIDNMTMGMVCESAQPVEQPSDEALLRQALEIISANYSEEYDEAHELSVERAIRARLEGGV